MLIADRVKEFRRIPAGAIRPNPKNWRSHPQGQRDAIKAALAEIGFAGAALVRELDDGTYMLLDGHARLDELPDDYEVPCLVLDLDESEADKLLLTYDAIGGMADADRERLDALLRDVKTGSPALQEMLAALAEKHKLVPGDEKGSPSPPDESNYQQQFGVIVLCDSEQSQKSVYEELAASGYNCKVVTT